MWAELLDLLGVGMKGSIGISAALLLGALYVYRAAAIAKLVGALFGSAVGYAIMLCVASAAAIALGWVDPNVGVIGAHVAEGLSRGLETAAGVVDRAARWFR